MTILNEEKYFEIRMTGHKIMILKIIDRVLCEDKNSELMQKGNITANRKMHVKQLARW